MPQKVGSAASSLAQAKGTCKQVWDKVTKGD